MQANAPADPVLGWPLVSAKHLDRAAERRQILRAIGDDESTPERVVRSTEVSREDTTDASADPSSNGERLLAPSAGPLDALDASEPEPTE